MIYIGQNIKEQKNHFHEFFFLGQESERNQGHGMFNLAYASIGLILQIDIQKDNTFYDFWAEIFLFPCIPHYTWFCGAKD